MRNGRRDGRKHIPTYAVTFEPGADLATAYEQRLRSEGRHEIDEQLRDFLRRTDSLRRRKAELESLLVRDEISVKDGRELLAEARTELTASDLEPRSPQEVALQQREPASLRSRRAAERRQRIDDAREALDRLLAAAADRHREIAEARGLVEVEFTHAQAYGRRLAGLCRIRISTYWDAVVQRHPDGRDLATTRPPARFDPPEWIDAAHWDGTEPTEEVNP